MAFDNMYLPSASDGYHAATFTAINTSPALHSSATVSPQELMNSYATPESGFLESPMMGSSAYGTTPLEDFMDDSLEPMNFPLFAQDGSDPFMEIPMQRSQSQGYAPATSAPMSRQLSGSSPGSRPGTAHSRKASLVSGVAKSTPKSRKPLPKIVIAEDDAKEVAKRKKNTAAARKSRENRANRMEYLEAEVERLKNKLMENGLDPEDGMDSPD